METLRLQKAAYSTRVTSGSGSGGVRKYHNAPKSSRIHSHTHSHGQSRSQSLNSKHPSLPRAAASANHYQQRPQVSLFSPPTPTHSHTHSHTQSKNPPTASNTVPISPIQSERKGDSVDTNSTISLPISGGSGKLNKKTNLDPLQSCYGSRGRFTKLSEDESAEKQEKPKGILSRPSSPAVTLGKKKKVTFNFEARTSSSSYAPPSRVTPSPAPIPTIVQARNSNSASGRPLRPSLSEQLSAIANKAGEVTADIKAKAGIVFDNPRGEKPLLTSPAKNFTVGHLQCRYPAPVDFYCDRFEYKFHHPFQNAEIQLVMYYRDMTNASLTASPSPGKLIFRVPRHLVHFAADYDPARHYVVLFLSSSMDLQFIKKNIMQKIK